MLQGGVMRKLTAKEKRAGYGGLLLKKGADQAISIVSAHNHLVRGDVKVRRVRGEWRCPSFPQSAGKVVRIRSSGRAPNQGPAAAARGSPHVEKRWNGFVCGKREPEVSRRSPGVRLLLLR